MTDWNRHGEWTITRRDLLKRSGALAAGLSGAASVAFAARLAPAEAKTKPIVRFGLVTDSHYADVDKAGSRYYRQSLDKMGECVDLMNEKKVAFLAELGDFKDQARPPKKESTIAYLRAIEKAFARCKAGRYHVLGNHDTDSISKAQFLANVRNTDIPRDKTHYSFDAGGVHFVVLDACYTSDGKGYDSGNFRWTDANVPKAQLAWLAKDIKATASPVIALVHQQLDGEGPHTIRNAAAVRKILGESGRVLAVFQGHNHAGGCSQVEGIHYYTLKAMVEGSGEASSSYAIAEVSSNLDITVTGYRRAVSKRLAKASR